MVFNQFFTKILAGADWCARILVIASAAAMVVVVSAQVVMRYVFNSSFDWADEISRLAFVATIFIAIPLGIREGSHVSIDMLVSRLPATSRRNLARLMSLVAAGLMGIVFWTAIITARVTWSERLGTLDLTSSVFFFPIIIGAAHAALHLLHLSLYPAEPRP
ncbi:TRAP transporter small permease [Martelella soudanensis]|uniref:TRAP transporter small permease n=1 Tax=unclassified Martelella TaxID=2629616 RepID=UPI0015DF68BA|nr:MULTISPECIES: TRAP transporter small permease subunit [unclassified Martelella]